jgi:hypothetical protein
MGLDKSACINLSPRSQVSLGENGPRHSSNGRAHEVRISLRFSDFARTEIFAVAHCGLPEKSAFPGFYSLMNSRQRRSTSEGRS